MTLVFLAATGPAKRAWQEDDFEDDDDFVDEEELESEPLLTETPEDTPDDKPDDLYTNDDKEDLNDNLQEE